MRERNSVFSVRLHRANQNYHRDEYVRRILWNLAKPVFRFSPRIAYGFRNGLLRLFGAQIGRLVRIYPSVDIFFPWNLRVGDEVTIGDAVTLYNLGEIHIGEGTMISYRAHFCAGTHDYTEVNLPLLKPKIVLGCAIWVCTEAYIGPGVTVGDFSIIGARAALHKSFPACSIIGGNPAKRIKERRLPEAGVYESDGACGKE